MSKSLLCLGAVLFAAFALSAVWLGTAAAQYTNDPFYEYPQILSHAYGLEMIGMRLTAIEALQPVPEDFMEQVEKLLGRDYPRFGGTLTERDAELAADLRETLEAIEEAAEGGQDVSSLLAEARGLVERAYEVLIGADLRAEPAFIGALLADLLLADDGVAEAYEDAAEEDLWEYPNGWASLQRVQVLWGEIEPLASAERQEDGREMLVALAEIYPSPVPPEEIIGDPEEAEAPAQRMTGIVEEVTDADLYPGRDLARLSGMLTEVLSPACAAYAEGRDDVGVEGIYAARNHYRKHLRRLLDLIAPEVHERATAHLDGLISDAPPAPADEACRDLMDALEEARGALGG